MSSKLYKHKKTGKLYSLVQENIKVKCDIVYLEDSNESVLNWKGGFILYKAEYNNTEGPYFVRYSKDFYDNFEEVKD